MAQIVPHIVLAAGVTLITLAVMVNANGLLNRVMFRIIPAIVGAATLFAAALLYMGGA